MLDEAVIVTRLGGMALAATLAAASLAPVGAHEWPDGPNKSFLQGLQRPDNGQHSYRDAKSRSCCGAGDVVKTRFKVESAGGKYPEDRWYAWLDERWTAIPPEKIVPDYAPDGQPYLFMLASTVQCFVRPKGGL